MADTGGTVEVTITPAVYIEIRFSDPDSTVTGDFLRWQLAEKVFPIRGTGSSSPVTRMGTTWYDGHYIGVFDAADCSAVKAWLAAQLGRS